MNQDINMIITTLGNEWAEALANANKKVAILAEENTRLKAENQRLTDQLVKADDNQADE